MSACLSVTVITSVDTRLKAATAMISVRMMNIMRFSVCTAANQLRFCCDQSRISRLPLRVRDSSSATCGALLHVGDAQAQAGRRGQPEHPFRVFDVHEGQRRIVFVMPGLEDAGHGELLQARQHAGRRHLALRRDQRHLVADAAPAAPRASSPPSTMLNSPGCQVVETALACTCDATSDTLRLLLRQHAADDHAAHRLAVRHHRLRRHVGRGALDFLVAGTPRFAVCCQSGMRAAWRRTPRYAPAPTACGRALPSGSRSSPTARRSAPPRPSAMPAIEISEMKEMKLLRPLRRPARV